MMTTIVQILAASVMTLVIQLAFLLVCTQVGVFVSFGAVIGVAAFGITFYSPDPQIELEICSRCES